MSAPARRLACALLALALAGALSACPDDGEEETERTCLSDRDCAFLAGPGTLCYANGCFTPGDGVVVEVTADPREGYHAQDVTLGGVRAREDFALTAPSALSGQLTRAAPDGGTPAPYPDAVTLRLSGQSTLLPGVVRTHEGLLRPNRGVYRLTAPEGTYRVLVQAADPALPPLATDTVLLRGQQTPLPLSLPAAEQLTVLGGRVERSAGVPLGVDAEVQALGGDGLPLSQPAPVSRATGAFSLVVGRDVAAAPALRLRVGPPPGVPLVPTRELVVDPRQPLTQPLLLGDFGTPVPVTGRVLGPAGLPVAGARVQLVGTARGGGAYRSAQAVTDAEGLFRLDSLPDDGPGTLVLRVTPARVEGLASLGGDRRFAGLLEQPVSVGPSGALGDLACPRRTIAAGQVLTPDGSPAQHIGVSATPVEALPGLPLPPQGTRGETSADGRFWLPLDPGFYRLDFEPDGALARTSRTLRVDASTSAAGVLTVALPGPVQLARGKRVIGRVTLSAGANAAGAVNARLRFFRAPPGSTAPAELLGESVTDASGNYTVVLP